MNISKLKDELKKRNMSIPALAKRMGVSKKLIYSRFNLLTSFTQKEISMISKILGLCNSQIIDIFLQKKFPKRNNKKKGEPIWKIGQYRH